MAEAVALKRKVLSEVYGSRHPTIAARLAKSGQAFLDQPALCRHMLVAEAGGRIVGTLWVHSGWVLDLYIERAQRAHGLGPRLLKAAEARLLRQGVHQARLQAAADYPQIVGFYESQGWTAGKRSRFEESEVELIEMTKLLQPRPLAAWRRLRCNAPKLALFGAIVLATWSAAELIREALAIEADYTRFIWLLMAGHALWNAALIRSEEFRSWRSRAIILAGMTGNIAVMTQGALAGAFLPRIVVPDAGSLVSTLFGMTLVFLFVTWADRMARSVMVSFWQPRGVFAGRLLSRMPSIRAIAPTRDAKAARFP